MKNLDVVPFSQSDNEILAETHACFEDLNSLLLDVQAYCSQKMPVHNFRFVLDGFPLECLCCINLLIRNIEANYADLKQCKPPVEIILMARRSCSLFKSVYGESLLPLLDIYISELDQNHHYCNVPDKARQRLSELGSCFAENQSYVDIIDLVKHLNDEHDKLLNISLSLRDKARCFYNCGCKSLTALSNADDKFLYLNCLKEYVTLESRCIEKEIYGDLKRRAQKMKKKRTDKLATDHWEMLLEAEDEMMKLAAKKQLVSSKLDSLDCYEDYDRVLLENNSNLIKLMLKIFEDDNLFDLDKISKLDPLLDAENINLFIRLLLKGNILRSEINDDVKAKYLEWIARKSDKKIDDLAPKASNTKSSSFKLSETDRQILDEILDLLSKGRWKGAANNNNIRELITLLFGANLDLLTDDDLVSAQRFRDFFRVGRGSKEFSRIQISVANLVGYFMECGYLDLSPKSLSIDFFMSDGCNNNINKGKSSLRCAAFNNLIPFLEKYRLLVIENRN